MSREFTASTGVNFTASDLVSAEPFTFASWVNSDVTSTLEYVLSVGDNSGLDHWGIGIDASDQAIAQAIGAATGTSTTTATISSSTWHHVVGVFTSSTSRTAYLDGTAGTENTTSVSPGFLNETAIGKRSRSAGGSDPWDGKISEVAIWNVALTAGEIKTLSNGVSPFRVRPESLLAYWPMHGLTSSSNETDYSGGGNTMTQAGTPASADHSPVAPMIGGFSYDPIGIPFFGGIDSVSAPSGGPRTILLTP